MMWYNANKWKRKTRKRGAFGGIVLSPEDTRKLNKRIVSYEKKELASFESNLEKNMDSIWSNNKNK